MNCQVRLMYVSVVGKRRFINQTRGCEAKRNKCSAQHPASKGVATGRLTNYLMIKITNKWQPRVVVGRRWPQRKPGCTWPHCATLAPKLAAVRCAWHATWQGLRLRAPMHGAHGTLAPAAEPSGSGDKKRLQLITLSLSNIARLSEGLVKP